KPLSRTTSARDTPASAARPTNDNSLSARSTACAPEAEATSLRSKFFGILSIDRFPRGLLLAQLLADRLFEDGPGFVAVLALPVGVEARAAEFLLEKLGIRRIELHALALEFGLDRGVETH